MIDRQPPKVGTFPQVSLGDGQWEHVLRALRRTGTKRDEGVARQIDQQVQEVRLRREIREGRL